MNSIEPKETNVESQDLIDTILQPAVEVLTSIATEISGEKFKVEGWDDFEWHPWEIF